LAPPNVKMLHRQQEAFYRRIPRLHICHLHSLDRDQSTRNCVATYNQFMDIWSHFIWRGHEAIEDQLQQPNVILRAGGRSREPGSNLQLTWLMMPSLGGCRSSSLGMRWMERPASFTVGTMGSRPFMWSAMEGGPRGGEGSLFTCLASRLM